MSSPPPSLPASFAPIGSASMSDACVLVVEDDMDLRDLLAEVLAEFGCDVRAAADAEAALAILRSAAAIDVLVTDIGLPGLDGRGLADAARLLRPKLPVLFITGEPLGGRGDAEDPSLPPGMGMIGKPFTLRALAARMSQIMGLPN